MRITATKLRQDVYKIVDQVLKTGVTVEIVRHGKIVRLVPEKPKSKLKNLRPHPDTIIGDPEDLVHIDWSKEWKGEDEL